MTEGGAEIDIERELVASQAEVTEIATQARLRRQRAVLAALDAGWSRYRIAQVMGIASGTLNAIIAAAERQEPPAGDDHADETP